MFAPVRAAMYRAGVTLRLGMDARPTSFGTNAQVLAFAARLPGEMAGLVLEKDWSKTPLGPVENWPAALRTAVEIVLASGFPMAVRWGPQLWSW